MRKTVFSLMVMTLLSWNAFAQDAGQKTVKAKKVAAEMETRSDAEVQTCVNDKFKDSKTIKNGNASVSGGTATLTGDASSGGAKGGATRSAKACGAKNVTNNIVVPPKPKKA